MRNGAAQVALMAVAEQSSGVGSFEEIVRRHQGMVFSLACHFLRDAPPALRHRETPASQNP